MRQLQSKDELFEGCQKKLLDVSSKRKIDSEDLEIFIYGIDREMATSGLDKLAAAGVSEVIEIKHKKGQIKERKPFLVKTVCESLETKNEILKNGALTFGCISLDVRDVIKYPTQCTRCLAFNHTSSICTSTVERCKECGGNHSARDCDSKERKCYNCGKDHSALYKGCIYSISIQQSNIKKAINSRQFRCHAKDQR
jgi:hypothetical protein